MPEKQYDSMADIDRSAKVSEASFGVRKRIPEKNNNEWYVLEAMHSSNVLVRVSGEDDDERCIELEAMFPSKTEAWCRNTKSKISFQLTRDGFHRV